MSDSKCRLFCAVVAGAVLALSLTAAAPSGTAKDSASARAYAVRVLLPDGSGGGSEEIAAPPDAISPGGALSYPEDGSVLTAATTAAAVSTAKGSRVRAQASAEAASLSLFGGEVTVERVSAQARVAASAKAASGETNGTTVTGLTVLGQPAEPGRVQLGDWGYADVSTGVARRLSPRGGNASRASAAALTIRLTAAHGALPAGSTIIVGFAEANATAVRPAPARRPEPQSRPAAPPQSSTPAAGHIPKRPPEQKPSPFGLPRIRTVPGNVTARLTPQGYVFPVYGPSSWSDTFGSPRANTGWHHGQDIFAPLGAPVLAVNDGWIFSVGFIPVGGNRLWLRDDQGNQFYYAHLSAFSPLAVNGRRVRAGDVIGFVGDTGDAKGTPFHLHFEIHPVRLLRLGYDGVVNPARFLSAWQRLVDLPFPVGKPVGGGGLDGGGLSGGGRTAWVGSSSRGSAPAPGAILLQASDISQASGLEHGSVEQAFADPARGEGDGALLRRG
jgi:murein DD-endopeptidase MepM/ murein hydrolase activator NlpD